MFPILLIFLASTTTAYLVPNPPGKYNVTLSTGSLIDYTRTDPEAGTPRELMVSVFQPATCTHTRSVRYMPEKTAEYQGPYLQQALGAPTDLSPLFLNARLPVCPIATRCSGNRPILLFSPGYSIPRFYYNILASAIASHDFTVITIDHPEDANIITYPDGHTVYNNNNRTDDPADAEYLEFQDRRVTDISFVVDQLSNTTAMAELLPRQQSLPANRIAVLGHSLGGSSALKAASQDSRLRGASNWDGTIFGSPETSKPVLLVSEPVETVSTTWNVTWPQLKGPKLWIQVANTSHYTFSDVPTLLQASGEHAAPYEQLLDTIVPAELVKIMASYTAAWTRGVFRGMEGGPLLRGEEKRRFPEVSTVLRGGF